MSSTPGSEQLVVRRDGVVIQTLPLGQGPITIGRSSECDLALPDQRVSRSHAILTREGNALIIVDRSSAGTLVGGTRLLRDQPHRLSPADEIHIGPFVLTYEAQAAADLGTILEIAQPPAPSVQALDGDGRLVQVLAVVSGSYRVGRDASNALVLDSRAVSREHVSIARAGQQVTVTDLNSANGTWLNGERLPAGVARQWNPGEALRIGPFQLKLDSGAASAPAAGRVEPSSAGVTVVTAGPAGATVRRWAGSLWVRLLAVGVVLALTGYFFALPPELSFRTEPSPASVASETPVTLIWSSRRMVSGELKSTDGRVIPTTDSDGSLRVVPTGDSEWTFTAANVLGIQSSKTVPVRVRSSPVIENFAPSVSRIATEGEAVTLQWSVKGATRLTISPDDELRAKFGDQPLPAQGTAIVHPKGKSAQYRLTAYNQSDPSLPPTTQVITIEVKPPVIDVFGTGSAAVFAGEGVKLNWQQQYSAKLTLKATKGHIQKGTTTVDVTGMTEYVVHPLEDSEYVLVAANAGGESAPMRATVTVKPTKIVYFRAEPPELVNGEESVLRWEVQGASDTELTVQPGVGRVGMSQTTVPVRPTTTTTYKLTAKGADDKPVSAEATISVKPKPVKTEGFKATPPKIVRGKEVVLSYTAENARRVVIVALSDGEPRQVFARDLRPDEKVFTGQAPDRPDRPTIYKLTVSNGPDEDSTTTEVDVEVVEVPAPLAKGTPQAPGAGSAVPFFTQLDGSSAQRSNCGPASLAMVLGYFRVNVRVVDLRQEVNKQMGLFDDEHGSSWESLIYSARLRQLEAVGVYDPNGHYHQWKTDEIVGARPVVRPAIVLVRYRMLPGGQNSNYPGDHYIVVLSQNERGDIVYHDPAFPGQSGANLTMSRAQLERAWSNTQSGLNWTAMGLRMLAAPKL